MWQLGQEHMLSWYHISAISWLNNHLGKFWMFFHFCCYFVEQKTTIQSDQKRKIWNKLEIKDSENQTLLLSHRSPVNLLGWFCFQNAESDSDPAASPSSASCNQVSSASPARSHMHTVGLLRLTAAGSF